VFNTNPIEKHKNGKSDAVRIIAFIQFLPAILCSAFSEVKNKVTGNFQIQESIYWSKITWVSITEDLNKKKCAESYHHSLNRGHH